MIELRLQRSTHRVHTLGCASNERTSGAHGAEVPKPRRSVIDGSIVRQWIFIFAARAPREPALGSGFRRVSTWVDPLRRAKARLRISQTQRSQQYCRCAAVASAPRPASVLPHSRHAPKKLKGADEEDLTRTFGVKTHYLYIRCATIG